MLRVTYHRWSYKLRSIGVCIITYLPVSEWWSRNPIPADSRIIMRKTLQCRFNPILWFSIFIHNNNTSFCFWTHIILTLSASWKEPWLLNHVILPRIFTIMQFQISIKWDPHRSNTIFRPNTSYMLVLFHISPLTTWTKIVTY